MELEYGTRFREYFWIPVPHVFFNLGFRARNIFHVSVSASG